MPFAVQKASGINVQTTSQPVLVVPLSVNQAPAPTELIQAPTPNTPATIAVDTSTNAMKGVASALASTQPRPRSKSPGAPANTSSVTVNKMGGSSTPPPSANVRVSVNKLG